MGFRAVCLRMPTLVRTINNSRINASELRAPVFKPSYKRYVVAILTLTYTFSQVDQVLIGLVLQPIQNDLRVSDTQFGFVTGIAFGLFYATLGLPVAHWADRGNRSTITALAIGLWGATVMSCLFVTNFAQLVFARMATAAGASACMPPTYSLVGDYFPETAERTRAMTIYALANPLSGFGGYVLRWLAERTLRVAHCVFRYGDSWTRACRSGQIDRRGDPHAQISRSSRATTQAVDEGGA